MKTMLFVCCCVVLILLPGIPAGAEQASLAEAARIMQERPQDTAAIAEALSQGLAAHPDSIRLLQARTDLYCSRGMLSLCRADARRIVALQPDAVESMLLLCMLDEVEGATPESCAPCYLDAAARFAARPTLSEEEKLVNALNRVMALLLARHPDAEKEKVALLKRGVNHPLLPDFDRKRVLQTVCGQTAGEHKSHS